MSPNCEIFLDWDKTADVLYVVREGYDLNALINENSQRVPGFVKRFDPISKECVGFIVHSFSERFPLETKDMERLKYMMDLSLRLTNETNSFAQAA